MNDDFPAIPCPMCEQYIDAGHDWAVKAHRQAHLNNEEMEEAQVVRVSSDGTIQHRWSTLGFDCMCGYSANSVGELARHVAGMAVDNEPKAPALTVLPGGYRHDETFQSYFGKLYEQAFDILVERQKKYGPENIRRQGLFGIFTRLRDDKMARLANSINGKIERGEAFLVMDEMAEEESIEDTLLDIANYALIMLSVYRGEWCPPLAEDE